MKKKKRRRRRNFKKLTENIKKEDIKSNKRENIISEIISTETVFIENLKYIDNL